MVGIIVLSVHTAAYQVGPVVLSLNISRSGCKDVKLAPFKWSFHLNDHLILISDITSNLQILQAKCIRRHLKSWKNFGGYTSLQKLATLSHSHPARPSPAFPLFLFYEMTTGSSTMQSVGLRPHLHAFVRSNDDHSVGFYTRQLDRSGKWDIDWH